MAMRCPSCQAPLPDGAKFCLKCGAATSPSSRPDKPVVSVPTCVSCGTALDPLSGRCPQCNPAAAPTVRATSSTTAVPRASLGERETLPGALPSFPTPAPPPPPLPPTEDYSELRFDAVPAAPPAPPATPLPAGPFVSSGLDATRDCLLELQPGGRFRPWELRRPYYSVGREGTKIILTDPHVSRRHLAVVRVGTDWLAINLSDKRLRVNGWEVQQKTLRSGDVLRLGHTWLVFIAGTLPRPSAPLRPMAGTGHATGLVPISVGAAATLDSVDEDELARFTLLAGGRPAGSTSGQPLLAGGHPICGVPLAGIGVAPFHCLFSWMPDGPHFFDLGGGVLLGGAPMNQGRLHEGHTLTFGGQTLTVCLSGDPCAPAAERLRLARATTPAVSLTVIYGPHLGETAVLPPGHPVVLGHADGADLHLPEDADFVPPRLEMCLEPSKDEEDARTPVVRLRVLEVYRGVVVNRQPLSESGTMRLGDVLQFGPPKAVGPTALLLHNDLRLDAW
ncbi:MAG: FHA domain-containing protein [Planctomycetes bacterium]|nr:FHA domain-containing protein [Planctomycetota bacterium]